jgi:hypothetical protein
LANFGVKQPSPAESEESGKHSQQQ